ncbi:unknown [Mycoplasma sp. CAG:472]|nr:unknown [Mycoplasma sp. CAG:472]
MLTCAVDSDRFTVNKINGKGNSALTYPIGLITIDEVEMAGNNFNESVKSHYLYTGAHYWTGTPAAFDGDFSFEYSAMDEGGFSMSDVGIRFAARGVVSLSSESKLLGSGTYNDVYVVS